MTADTSAGWFAKSPGSIPPAAAEFVFGNAGAATTYPAAAHATSRPR